MMTKDKKDFYRTTEAILYNYRNTKLNIDITRAEIEGLKQDISDLEYEIDNIGTIPGIDYASRSEGTASGGINKSTEKHILKIEAKRDLIIKKCIEIEKLEDRMKTNKRTIEKIERAVRNLGPTYRMIVRERYFNGLEWHEVVEKAYLEERQCRTKKNEAIKSISIALFGSAALGEQEPLFSLIN